MAGDWEFCELWDKDKLVAEVKKLHGTINRQSHEIHNAEVAIRCLLQAMGVKNIAPGYSGVDHAASVDKALKVLGHKFRIEGDRP